MNFSDILCDISKSQNNCPKNSACKQFSELSQNTSRCECLADFKWNGTLCDKIESLSTTTKIITTTTQKVPTTNAPSTKDKITQVPASNPTTVKPTPTIIATTVNVTNSTDNSFRKAEEPGSHHVFGGIFIPIFIVIVIFGSIFAVKKYDLIERGRDYFRGRHYRSNYEDILTMEDDDDPPLI